MSAPENPWAFPVAYPSGANGMTLRDWFAGQALAGQLAFSPHDSEFEKWHQPEDVARAVYRFADAMLAARAESAA